MATDIEIFVGTSQDFLLSFKVKETDKVSPINRTIIIRSVLIVIVVIDVQHSSTFYVFSE